MYLVVVVAVVGGCRGDLGFCFLLLLLLLKGRCGFGLILWVVVVWFVFYFDFVGCRDFDFFCA